MNSATSTTQPTFQLRYAAYSHQGKRHHRNQDAILVADCVTNELSDLEIADSIAAEDLPASARRLFDAVMAQGAGDDASAVFLAWGTR